MAARPPEECDLIMKGGVTSGIVYPPAVLELKDRYRFRSIGGASAGAIAAAVTAAAEYGREGGGFERLRRASGELAQEGFLKRLFQPAPALRPLFAVALDLAEQWPRRDKRTSRPAWRALRALAAALWRNDRGAVLGGAGLAALLAGGLGWLHARAARPEWLGRVLAAAVVIGLALVVVGGLAGGLRHLYRIATTGLPQNFHGLCPGLGQGALTNWLDGEIQKIAGLPVDGRALTFGDLREREIDLQMVTSNLAHHRPYLLPFDQGIFIFREEDCARLFPPRIVRQLVTEAPPSRSFALPEGHHFLPRRDRLPVIVATRLSLSFPILISAVPLYTISDAALRRKRRGEALVIDPDRGDLQRNWFSDGGISSNFPIHFFDRWLPSRPTFGITLASLPEDAFTTAAADELMPAYLSLGADEEDEAGEEAKELLRSVYLPRANSQVRPEWVPLESLPAFVYAIFATAQNFRDTTQAALPSYRERVVQIRLSDREGGLNLTMGREIIERVVDKGQRAGAALREFRFERHWWVRFRVLMSQLELELQRMEQKLEEDRMHYREILREQRPRSEGGESYPYDRPGSWAAEAEHRLGELRALVRGWGTNAFFAENPPRPEPALRVTPRI